jgi:hypothetical protein
MQKDIKLSLKGFDIVPDDSYDFDFAVYKENTK